MFDVFKMLVVPEKDLRLRTYNIQAMSFTPEEIAAEIRKYVPELKVTYKPDFRQNIGTLSLKNVCLWKYTVLTSVFSR